MFEFISNLPAADAAGGVYYAMRVIKHVKHVPEVQPDFVIDAPSEPSLAHREIKDRIIGVIEQSEHVPLRSIPKHVIEKYVHRLAMELQAALKQQWRYSEERGDELLAQLRRGN